MESTCLRLPCEIGQGKKYSSLWMNPNLNFLRSFPRCWTNSCVTKTTPLPRPSSSAWCARVSRAWRKPSRGETPNTRNFRSGRTVFQSQIWISISTRTLRENKPRFPYAAFQSCTPARKERGLKLFWGRILIHPGLAGAQNQNCGHLGKSLEVWRI